MCLYRCLFGCCDGLTKCTISGQKRCESVESVGLLCETNETISGQKCYRCYALGGGGLLKSLEKPNVCASLRPKKSGIKWQKAAKADA